VNGGIGALHDGERTLAVMPVDAPLRAELLAMAATAHDPEVLRAHAERLWEILDDYECWPGRRLVGDDGSRAAWLVAQCAIDDVGLQKRCLEALEDAVASGDADPVDAAYLLDRVRMADGLDQLYGSQFVLDRDGALVPWPVDDIDAVERRRRRLGLGPFHEHAATMAAQWRARRDQRGSESDASSAARQQYQAATER
jgi:Family of unknown function (DUF6624)